ncbi:anti-phage dCTP deaminase [Phenylobacterium sp.]|uniref:anti-phage dCTP deaminase n=1 Tax=Phenylobacterium sp. TaxID=1871053 RepID=UPI003002AF76
MLPQPKDAELFIGIVARVGVDLKKASQFILNALDDYGYEVFEIKTTAALLELKDVGPISDKTAEEKYATYIQACNGLRKTTRMNDIMARLAVSQISTARGEEGALRRRAYIINQLKRHEESELLRSIYGEHYIQISIHTGFEQRERQLSDRIADDHAEQPRGENWITNARRLMDKDEAQEDEEYGQSVRDVFPTSDVVVDATSPISLKDGLNRFFRALFGDFRVTPTLEEYGMQLANTAALRSSDLSRQVGAAIINRSAEIQALGCNEVPKAGGGTYWTGDDNDGREFQLERDSNDERKRELLLDIAARMADAGLISDQYKNDANALRKALLDREDDKIKNSQLMDSLEYGRTVHAEMNAITDAARNGHAIRGCDMYVNTFPCHNCAKHIVASGIKVVHYLRPYPKSYARQLFRDSIVIDPPSGVDDKLVLKQFIGICGPIFERIFSKQKWKGKDGIVPPFNKKGASFIRRTPIPAYIEAEKHLLIALTERLLTDSLIDEPQPGAAKA